ncbi:hypothetical protein MMC27_001632 [Xylographa pallens]|nr:hypothetical protein [Xylographa pallens]
MPYWIPLLGHATSFLWDIAGLATSIMFVAPSSEIVGLIGAETNMLFVSDRFGTSIPVRLRLFHTELYFLSGTQNLKLAWKKSHVLSSKVQVLIGVGMLFGTSTNALKFYESDDSGINLLPHPKSKIRPENRIHYLTHKTTVELLAGTHLQSLAKSFQVILKKRLCNLEVGLEWTDMRDLLSLLQHHMFSAAVEGMCGPYFLLLNPDFAKNFWDFDTYTPYILKGYPRILKPTAWRARDRCLESVRKWHAYIREHDTITLVDTENAQDPYYGTGLMRARQNYSSKMEPMTADAIASADLGLIWATNSNTIPAAFWMLVEVVRDPSLLSRVRGELSNCVSDSFRSDSFDFDIPRLCEQPLLQSVYAEVLRLYTAVMIVRSTEHTDVTIGNWNFPKHSLIAISSQVAHMDKEAWSIGHEALHPLEEFWAERFLVYPHDPNSGPSIKRSPGTTPYATKRGADEPRFSTGGVAGSWIPYGGGQKMCPGRHFAKQEILLTFAMLCSAFDIKLSNESKTRPDMKFYGLGVLPPQGETPFCIRRRNGMLQQD